MSKSWLRSIAWLALVVSGCGLEDYEKRMDVERKRMRIYDAEDAQLTGPLDPPAPRKVPGKKDETVAAWPFEVFLRAPLGFERGSSGFNNLNDVFLDRFACPADGPSQERPNATAKPAWTMFVAVSKVGEMNKATETFKPGELSQVEFRRRVLKTLREYYREKYKGLDFEFAPPKEPKKETKMPDFVAERVKEPPPALEFEVFNYSAPTETKDPTTFLLYFYRCPTAPNQIAVIYQMPKAVADDPRFLEQINYSLKSLDISDRAIEKKMDYTRTHRPVTAKKT